MASCNWLHDPSSMHQEVFKMKELPKGELHHWSVWHCTSAHAVELFVRRGEAYLIYGFQEDISNILQLGIHIKSI